MKVEPQRWAAAGVVVVALAVVLRAVALTSKSFSFDETFSVFIASQPVARVVALTAVNETHPPLYYLLLHYWIRLFGDGELAVRALSVPISAAVVASTWFFGRVLLGPAPALVAAILVAVAPAQVAIGQEARMYPLLTLTALCSWWALWAGITAGRARAWGAYAMGTAAMLYSHYYGLFVVVSQVAFLAWRGTDQATWRRWVYATLAVLVLYLPWMWQLPGQLATGRAWPAYRPPLSAALFADTLTSLTVGQQFFDAIGEGSVPRHLAWPLGVIALLIVVAGLRGLSSRRDVRALLLSAGLLPITFAYGVSHVAHVFAPRYLTFALPAFAMLLGAGVLQLIPRAHAHSRWLVTAAMAVLVIANAGSLVRYYRQPLSDVFDWRTVSATLAAAGRPGDAIVFLPGFSRIPVNYYLRGGPRVRLALTPRGLDVEGPGGMSAVIEQISRHPRVWIVTLSPGPEAVDVLTIALEQQSYAVRRREAIHRVRLVLLEKIPPRVRAPTGRP